MNYFGELIKTEYSWYWLLTQGIGWLAACHWTQRMVVCCLMLLFPYQFVMFTHIILKPNTKRITG